MEQNKNKSKLFFQKIKSGLRKKYQLSIFEEETYELKTSIRLSAYNIILYLVLIFIISTALAIFILIFSPLNSFIPTKLESNIKKQLIHNAVTLDSLEKELKFSAEYYNTIKKIIIGEELDNKAILDTSKFKNVDYEFAPSQHDSLLQDLIEEAENENLSKIENTQGHKTFVNLHFFTPVKGAISKTFNASEGHYGIDVVAGAEEPVLATLEGTVVNATWEVDFGHVIQIQHSNNLISVYKHNSVLLKKLGDHVLAGEAIAIIGNSGELTSGTHLHFELWHNGVPIDPANYITF